MINLKTLHLQLKRAGVTDDVLSRGLRLTSAGYAKLARKYNVGEQEIKDLISELAQKLRADISSSKSSDSGLPTLESDARYAYEADSLGNVMLRDTETGADKFLSGQEAQLLLAEIERVHPNFQGLISPYFDREELREVAEADVLGVEEDGNTGGTYNFPYMGNFACARFWLENSKPRIEVISMVDVEGEEVHMDVATKAGATKAAWEWVNKV